MSNYFESRRKILQLIKSGKVKAEDGFRLIKKLDGQKSPEEAPQRQDYSKKDIAIIGISCRFPDADSPEQFWQNLRNGKDSISEIPNDRWSIEGFYSADRQEPDRSYSKWGGFIKDISSFDPLFFNISPREAEYMDPQQRLFLEEAWKALEDAGYSDKRLSGTKCGVFAGAEPGDYLNLIRENSALSNSFSAIGNAISILSARISYFLNLKGPSLTIDTACSSSLVAVHLACESILSGTSTIAIAGGVTLYTTPEFYLMTSKANMLSPTGRCHTFDNSADGFVPGEGVGVVVLKPLAKALEDSDNIYGVIKASGINQDGKTNGITAPSSPSQTDLECEVYDKVNFSPETISYIEAHGTGTKLGDPIEIQALTDSFSKYTDKKRFCAIGSVKSNIGHTVAAAGVAGLIKLLLSLKHKELPPSINFNNPNEHIDFNNSPLYVNNSAAEWPAGNYPRRAGLSSFGFSGTNSHLLIEEWTETKANRTTPYDTYLIPLSAKSEKALQQKIDELVVWLEKSDDTVKLADIAYTLGARRTHFNYRAALVTKNKAELIVQLKELSAAKNFSQKSKSSRKASAAVTKVDADNLQELAELYTEKMDIKWEELYKPEDYTCLSLPSYPFAREKYWISDDQENVAEKISERDEIEDVRKVIKQIISELIKVETRNIDDSTPLEEFGIDSIILMEIIQKIGANFKIELKLSDIQGLDTVNDWADYIEDIYSTKNYHMHYDVSEKLKQIISETVKINSQHLDDSIPLEEFGIDSIILMELIQKIGKSFKLELKLSDIHGLDTVNCWKKYIELNQKGNIAERPKDSFPIDSSYVNKIVNKYKYAFNEYYDKTKISFIKSSQKLNIEYFMYGEGQPILLLPPFFGTATSWMFQIPELAKTHKVIAFHYPGCGRSEFIPELSTFDAISNNIIENIHSLKIDSPLHLISWSMGGFIAQKLAANHPELVKSLVLVNTSSNAVQKDSIENVVKMSNDLAHDFNSGFPKSLSADKEAIMNSIKGSFNNEISIHYVYEAFRFNYTAELDKIKAPTLIVTGGKDKLYSPEHSITMHENIKQSKYELIKSAGHYIPVNNHTYFNRLLLNFIKNR